MYRDSDRWRQNTWHIISSRKPGEFQENVECDSIFALIHESVEDAVTKFSQIAGAIFCAYGNTHIMAGLHVPMAPDHNKSGLKH